MLGQAILSFIERLSSLWRLKCIDTIGKWNLQESFIERSFLLCFFLIKVSFIGGSTIIDHVLTTEERASDVIMHVLQHLYAPPTPSLNPPAKADAGVSPRNATRQPL